MEKNKTRPYEWAEFLLVLKQNRKTIIIFVFCSCLAVSIITFFIPKQYMTHAIIFPTESNSLDDAIGNPQFGYDVEADRLIQLLDSRTIRDSIIQKFDLINYYDIDTVSKDWDYTLMRYYTKDINFSRTRFMSIIITVRSRDPQMAAQIANELVVQVGILRDRLLKSNIYLAISSLQHEYDALKSDLDSLSQAVIQLTHNSPEIWQYLQADRYVSMIFNKDQMADDELGNAVQIVVNQYNIRLSWFYDVSTRLKNAVLMSERPLPAVYIIEPAVPNFKKSYPSLKVNLIVGFVFSFAFISLFLFILHKINTLKGKL